MIRVKRGRVTRTTDVGLASAGYNARAQDPSTVFTNPAGMTRLDGTQFRASGQVLWGDTKFSIGSGTPPRRFAAGVTL